MNDDRETLAAFCKDAFYAARDAGRTMHQAADDAAVAILEAGWVSPEDHRDALIDAAREGFGNGVEWAGQP